MKLFTCGPVQMYPSTTIVRSKGFIHFRTNEYGDLVNKTLKRLSNLLGNNNDNSLIYIAASGTASMEATIENCVTKEDKVLVINGGGFGKRFCELLDYHNKSFDSVNINWNETLAEKHLKPFENKGFTMLFVNLHETTSGQLYDIQLLSDFAKKNNMMFVVDAISTFLCDDYNMDKYGIDLTIISSQKGLCCSPGMSLVSFSQRMIDKINNNQLAASKYFDFKDYLINIPRGQTPYTPPVLVMYEIEDMLNIIDTEGGKEARLKTIEEKCRYFREKIKSIGLKIPTYPLSNMLTPVLFEDVNAYDVIQVLKDKYRIYVNPCGGELATKLLRVSHIGNTTIADIDDLVEKIQKSVNIVREEN
ncbi:alanine--glyoxylate aminotransferase family protein [bacterium]|nr:alanine--glyoxylate aminotransferase family protein [bacterium]